LHDAFDGTDGHEAGCLSLGSYGRGGLVRPLILNCHSYAELHIGLSSIE
jgi:hypothetical protein